MEHSINILIYTLNETENEDFDDTELEVTFEFNRYGYEITGYYMNSQPINIEEIRINNKDIDLQIDNMIEHYISNYEPEYIDMEK